MEVLLDCKVMSWVVLGERVMFVRSIDAVRVFFPAKVFLDSGMGNVCTK